VAAEPNRLRSAALEQRLMRIRGDLLVLIGAVIVTALVALSSPQQEPQSTYSSYDTGRNGYRALYEILRSEGVRTGRFEAQLGTLHRSSVTMIVSDNAAGHIVMPGSDVQRLASIVRSGAHLVVTGQMLDSAKALQLPDTVSMPKASTAVALPSLFTKNVSNVAGSFSSAFASRRGVRALLLANRRAVAIEYPLGRGRVIAIGAPDVFSNAVLARDRNAWFAWNVLTGTRGVLFYERLHGYASGSSIWSVMPSGARDAVWICVAIVLLAVVGNAFRSAPPVALAPRRPRDSSAYITAMASLLRRAHAGGNAIERFSRDAARLVRRRPSLSARPEIREWLERLDALASASRPSDADVLAAARHYVSLQRELAA
jgi:hypothetical protein